MSLQNTKLPERIWARAEKNEFGGQERCGDWQTKAIEKPDWHDTNMYTPQAEYVRVDVAADLAAEAERRIKELKAEGEFSREQSLTNHLKYVAALERAEKAEAERDAALARAGAEAVDMRERAAQAMLEDDEDGGKVFAEAHEAANTILTLRIAPDAQAALDKLIASAIKETNP